jgi:D-beta-D-heptose 7-phosphate kinase/D-beta-D-heptose 1-phosphate adenosyltransferase
MTATGPVGYGSVALGSVALGSVAHELHAWQGAHVLVVGDVMLDRYIHGEVRRVSPEAPVPVLVQRATELVLGGAANVAANVVSLGARATLVGRVGDDAEGRELTGLLDALGLLHDLVALPGVPTTTKTRVVAGTQQLTRIDREVVAPGGPDERAAVLSRVTEFLAQPGDRAIVLADYAKGLLHPDLITEVIARAVEAGVPVVTDPKDRDLSRYAGSTVIKPNLAEARAACAVPGAVYEDPQREIAYLLQACLEASGAANVVLSCSADGVAVLGAQAPKPTRLASNARDVADVSGAGDTLVALIAVGLAARWPLQRAVEVANLAAGAVCAKPGTATVTATELLALIGGAGAASADGRHQAGRKVLAGREEAGEVGAQYLLDGRRLVFANGCFDLLHAGHIKLLGEARALGDALMVALNTDKSVRRLKGEGRPVQAEADRCQIMAALACVDYVVLFDEDTPLELIQAVRPAVLVKGDDYPLDAVVGAAEVASWGGTVALVARVDGRSTTRIIESGR